MGAAAAECAVPLDEQDETHRSLAVWLLTQTGRLQEATQRAQEGRVQPETLANLGMALYEAGQREPGRRMMAAACPQLAEDDAARCHTVLSEMR